MPHSTTIPLLLLTLACAIWAQTQCPSACFQGTPQDAGPPVDDSLCPPAAGIVNPFYTSSCLCYTPETFDGSPWLFCYTCGSATGGDFASICGTTPVTQSCPNQQDGINEACKANSDVSGVLGDLCSDGKPSNLVTGITSVVTFFEPELAEGALELLGEGCSTAQTGQTISGAVGDFCNVWQSAGCGTLDASSGSTGSSTSSATSSMASNLANAIPPAFAFVWGLLVL